MIPYYNRNISHLMLLPHIHIYTDIIIIPTPLGQLTHMFRVILGNLAYRMHNACYNVSHLFAYLFLFIPDIFPNVNSFTCIFQYNEILLYTILFGEHKKGCSLPGGSIGRSYDTWPPTGGL